MGKTKENTINTNTRLVREAQETLSLLTIKSTNLIDSNKLQRVAVSLRGMKITHQYVEVILHASKISRTYLKVKEKYKYIKILSQNNNNLYSTTY